MKRVDTSMLTPAETDALSSESVQTLVCELRNWNSYPISLTSGGPATSLGRAEMQAIAEHRDRLVVLADTELSEIIGHIDKTIWAEDVDDGQVLARDPEALASLALADLRFILQTTFFDIEDALHDPDAGTILTRFPELKSHLDDDGLLILDGVVIPQRCYLTYGSFAFYYSQFLRRKFTSNTNDDFTAALLAHRTSTDNRIAVAIDHRRLIEKESANDWFELDHWWGPPFSAVRLDEAHERELTVYEDPEGLAGLLSEYKKMEFYWAIDDEGLKSLQAEELVPLDSSPLSGYMINRYVHAIRDTKAKKFIHLDGAVRLYPVDEYQTRFEAKLPVAPKAARYIKLFRVDGEIPEDDWAGLVISFFRGNHHVLDYLNPGLEHTDSQYGRYKQLLLKLSGELS